ncbi:MAG: Vgb family protein [Acidimicrobiales bacterium]
MSNRPNAIALVIAATLALAGGIHLGVAPSHFSATTSHGMFMIVAAIAQLGLAVAVLRGRRPWATIAATSAVIVGIWLVSRTMGMPASLGGRESVGAIDGVATAFAALAAMGSIFMAESKRLAAMARSGLRPVGAAVAVAGLMTLGSGIAYALPSHHATGTHGDALAAGDGDQTHAGASTDHHSETDESDGADHASRHGSQAGGHGSHAAGPARAADDPLAGLAVEQVADQPESAVAAFGSLWVTSRGDGTLRRLDASSGKAVAPPLAIGSGVARVVASPTTIWVTDTNANELVAVNPASNAITSRTPVGLRPVGVAVAGNRVHVLNSTDGTISVVDAMSRRVVRTTPRLGYGLIDAVTADGSVWVIASLDHVVLRVDPVTATPVAAPILVEQGTAVITEGHGSIWVGSATTGNIARIDPAVNNIVGLPIKIAANVPGPGFGVSAIAVSNGKVWAAVTADHTVITLDIATNALAGDIRYLDNAAATSPESISLAPTAGGVWATVPGSNRAVLLTR